MIESQYEYAVKVQEADMVEIRKEEAFLIPPNLNLAE